MENSKESDVCELANEFQKYEYKKFVKALILFENKETIDKLNSSQIESVLDEVYGFYMDSHHCSFLQEEINEKLQEYVDRELSIDKSKKDSLER